MPSLWNWRTRLLLMSVVCEPPAPCASTSMPEAFSDPDPFTLGLPITLLEIVPLNVPVPLPLLTWIAPPELLPTNGLPTVPLFRMS